ncbi:MAG: hypothetical protein H0Z32_12090 [Bacillaceae bacterium]|nr:hypothetical protein [Bacillaceae bacterium]
MAEIVIEMDYREVACVLNEWTAVHLSHTTEGSMVRRVGEPQAQAEKEMVEELEKLPLCQKGKR